MYCESCVHLKKRILFWDEEKQEGFRFFPMALGAFVVFSVHMSSPNAMSSLGITDAERRSIWWSIRRNYLSKDQLF
eukprot:scaffold5030_cov53-Cylindrotheca_fusiformis.AAC.1